MQDLFANPQAIWFSFGLILLLGELILPGVLLIFFGLGAWTVVLISIVITLGGFIQFAVFIVASVVYLLLLRTRITALLYGKTWKFTNYASSTQDDVMGREVDVSQDIIPPHPGYVLLNGTLWQAKAAEAIATGSRVRIIKQDVLLLTVEKVV